MNLKSSIRAFAIVCVGIGVSANAALLSSESFDIGGGQYSLGDIAGQNPANPYFNGAWFKGDPGHSVNIVGTGLTWTGLQTSGGSLATGPVGRAGRNLTTAWDNTTVGTYYVSFLASFGVGGTHHRVVEAWNAPSLIGADGTRSLEVGGSTFTGLGTVISLSVNNGGGGANETDFDNNVDITTDNGATHLFVLRFDLQNAPGGDVVYGYMDPSDLVNEPGSPNAFIAGFDFGLAAFGGVVNFVFDGTPTSYFDELRFGTTYGDVLPAAIPEPTTFSLVGLGGLSMIMALRRKKA